MGRRRDAGFVVATKAGIEKDGATADGTRPNGRPEALDRHIGVSNVPTGRFRQALASAPIAPVRTRSNVAGDGDRDMVALRGDHGIAHVPWRPPRFARS